ncbi:MAG: hypothetical protein MUE95_10380 [Cyclobacteriaceae bacterium]|jgi:hypothetical protein|nr:hypothetical protein [Cyclobacteriaceae bacterium]
MNRYAGEIHLNPVSILRNHDFNNEGDIADIQLTLQEALDINERISNRIRLLKEYLMQYRSGSRLQFNFAPGGYIAVKGLDDHELLDLEAQGLIELFDFATDRDWVKKYGRHFGLVWENGRAIRIEDM